MLLVAVQGRPAHLRRVHHALLDLEPADRQRLGIIAHWKHGPHLLTYRQTRAHLRPDRHRGPAKDSRTAPRPNTLRRPRPLLEASVQVLGEPASSSYAVDWTDHETWSRPPPKRDANAKISTPRTRPRDDPAAPNATTATRDARRRRRCADPEASWGHRRGNHPGQKDEAFYGYYLQAVTIVKDEHGPAVPELARRMQLTSCHLDPPAALVPVLERMHSERGHDRRRAGRLRLRLPRPRNLGAPDPPARRRPDPGPAPQRPRTPRHPHGRDLRQRPPLLPRHPTSAARHRNHSPAPPPPSRQPHTTNVRRAREIQALADHPPRSRRLPPRDLPRRPGQAPLPAPPRIAHAPARPPHVLTPPEHPPACCPNKRSPSPRQ